MVHMKVLERSSEVGLFKWYVVPMIYPWMQFIELRRTVIISRDSTVGNVMVILSICQAICCLWQWTPPSSLLSYIIQNLQTQWKGLKRGTCSWTENIERLIISSPSSKRCFRSYLQNVGEPRFPDCLFVLWWKRGEPHEETLPELHCHGDVEKGDRWSHFAYYHRIVAAKKLEPNWRCDWIKFFELTRSLLSGIIELSHSPFRWIAKGIYFVR